MSITYVLEGAVLYLPSSASQSSQLLTSSEYVMDLDELKDIHASFVLDQRREPAECEIISIKNSNATKLVLPCSPARSVSSSTSTTMHSPNPMSLTMHSPNPMSLHSPIFGSPGSSSSEFFAKKRKEVDEKRSKLRAQVNDIEEKWSQQQRCFAFEELKRLKIVFDVKTKETKEAELNLKMAESVVDEVKAIAKRTYLLNEQLNLLL